MEASQQMLEVFRNCIKKIPIKNDLNFKILNTKMQVPHKRDCLALGNYPKMYPCSS